MSRARATLAGLAVLLAAACSSPAGSASHLVTAVGAENFYANVISQVGGPYVSVSSILSNPNTDPHSYESSTTDANAVSNARLIVQNGIGYDAFMQKLEDASPNSQRAVIDVGHELGYNIGDNPHLWYNPATMPRVATMVAEDLSHIDPAHAKQYRTNAARFVESLRSWTGSIAAFKRAYKGVPVAVTEPVFDYTAQAMGATILTPQAFQLAIEEGNDPAPQDVATVRSLLERRAVRVFVYNQQTVEPTTAQLLEVARRSRVPVVGVYETMPTHMDYQQWMNAEVSAVARAVRTGQSTEILR